MLELTGKIINYEIKYDDPDFRSQIAAFKEENENRPILLTLTSDIKAEFFQYKYYWGHLLPDIADILGYSVHRAHFMCKRDLLYTKVQSVDDIKKTHLNSGIYPVSYDELYDMSEKIPYSMIKGALIVENHGELVGYVPSVSKNCFRYKEMKKYLEDVENILFSDLSGHFSDRVTAMIMRERAQKESMFDEEIEVTEDMKFENMVEI